MKPYDHTRIEKKWQKIWQRSRVYSTHDPAKNGRKKFYVLDMFPYPSGEGLHVGHPKGYIATDVVSRMKRMQGHNVLHPMGFDAFGLPAENYALKMKTNPAIAVKKNIARYKKQLEIFGFDYDWSREVQTTDPKFYAWTQWIFTKLFERGLAYESFEPINWCPVDKTGLANEDVEDGRCERCGSLVEKKPLRQWVLKITDYAERLLADLDAKNSDGTPYLAWPESIKEAQRNWIGKSEGSEIDFALTGNLQLSGTITIFTTRPDTLFGVTYIVLAPEHPQLTELLKHVTNAEEVTRYIAAAKVRTTIDRTDATQEKHGVALSGVFALHPITHEKIPVWIADYVLAEYGTGAVMAVPAHDERDFIFSNTHSLPIKSVLEPLFIRTEGDDAVQKNIPFTERSAALCIVKHWSLDKYLCLRWKKNNWGGFVIGGIEQGERAEDAVLREIKEETGYLNAQVVRKVGVVHSKFFHSIKNVNRFAHFQIYEVNLLNDEHVQISEEEKALHDIHWISEAEVKKFLNREDMVCAWDMYKGTVLYTGEGLLSHSGSFSGMDSKDSRKPITEAAQGRMVTKYKLRDWVFSRQRYWGEPIPVLHSDVYEDVVEVHTPLLEINFYDEKIWKLILSGEKTIETRALNPEEPERYFGGIVEGDYITGVFKKTDEKRIFRVKKVYRWNSLEASFADPEIVKKISPKTRYKNLEQWIQGYERLAPAYSVKCNKNGIVGWEIEIARAPIAVSDKDLPVTLPNVKSYEPTGTGESPLAGISSWMNVKQGRGSSAHILHRESNTMPQWAGSSWYYLRYMDPHNSKKLVDEHAEKYWNSVDLYVGGAEHATRHLIYARFWHKFLFDIGVVSTIEPFKKLQNVGLIMAEDGRKMSKRWGNVVNPDTIIESYGADTLRLYEMFMGPFDQAIAWSTENIIGTRRFIERVWKFGETFVTSSKKIIESDSELEVTLNKTTKKVSEDIETLRFNTAISSLMIALNDFEKSKKASQHQFEIFLKLLSPFAPHITDELWSELGNKGSIHATEWPKFDPTKLIQSTINLAVQVNGKVRATLTVAQEISEQEALSQALSHPEIVKWVGSNTPKKVIFVKGRLLSIVV